MTDPVTDQKKARLRDLQRLRELMHPYVTSGAEDFRDAIPRMPDAEADEALALIDRTATWHEPPETAAARQEALLRLAEYEAIALDVLARNPHSGLRGILDDIARYRDRLAGLPPAADSTD